MSHGLRAELRKVIPREKADSITRAFDIYGSKLKAVAVIEIPEELKDYEGPIAEAIMKVNKNVTSILAKESARTGDYRTRDLRLIAGEPDTEVLHRESGCLFRLDPRTIYFSPRESRERDRLAAVVGGGEDVLVMFSGVGPLPIRIAKSREDVTVVAVELNPSAHNYCVENVHLNKVSDRVEPILGDVREVCPILGRRFDRIMMPLPRGAHMFLDVAVPILKEGGVLHFYHWAPTENLFSEAEELLQKAAGDHKMEAEITDRVRVSQYSPRTWKIRVDARMSASPISQRRI